MTKAAARSKDGSYQTDPSAMPRSPDGVGEDREAIRPKPDYAAAFNNRGIARRAKGDLRGSGRRFQRSRALESCRRSLLTLDENDHLLDCKKLTNLWRECCFTTGRFCIIA